ncbi:MAG: SDR family NAD(P)-dependent oxidoreductase [Alphaproteobacteria bacterium]
MIDLKGKVALVTGGSRGIGAAIVRTLADAGGDVVLHYGRSRERAEALAGELGRERCRPIAADLDDGETVPGLWREAVGWKGRIDVLVNNAGVYLAAGVDDDFATWSEVWARSLAVNLVASAHLCREAVRHFRERGGGTIINIASRAAFRGDAPDYTHYAASKAGMVALTRTIARGFGGDGVLAYAIAPGFVRTEMAEAFFAEHGEEGVVSEIPLGAVAPPQDIANVVAFLAAGLAPHATGTTIDVNGASYVR